MFHLSSEHFIGTYLFIESLITKNLNSNRRRIRLNELSTIDFKKGSMNMPMFWIISRTDQIKRYFYRSHKDIRQLKIFENELHFRYELY